MQRVVFMLDRAVKGVTDLSPSTTPKAIEWGGTNGTNNLFGNCKIEYAAPDKIWSWHAQNAPSERAQAAAVPDAPILEAEIAALLAAAGDGLRQPDDRDRQEVPAFHRIATAPVVADEGRATPSKKIELKVNETCPDPRAWHSDIRVNDPERAAKAVSSPGAQGAAAVLAVLLGAAGTAWIVGWPPALIDRLVSIPAEQKGDASGQIGSKNQTAIGGPGTGREAAPAVPDTGKIAASAPSLHRHRHGYTQGAALQPGAIKTSNVAQPSARPSEPAISGGGRRPGIFADLPPFPETRPTTIEGWVVRDVAGAMAVLEGPDGVWRAARGDTVPQLGRVESIVRWGNRWIVVTSSGLVSTP